MDEDLDVDPKQRIDPEARICRTWQTRYYATRYPSWLLSGMNSGTGISDQRT